MLIIIISSCSMTMLTSPVSPAAFPQPTHFHRLTAFSNQKKKPEDWWEKNDASMRQKSIKFTGIFFFIIKRKNHREISGTDVGLTFRLKRFKNMLDCSFSSFTNRTGPQLSSRKINKQLYFSFFFYETERLHPKCCIPATFSFYSSSTTVHFPQHIHAFFPPRWGLTAAVAKALRYCHLCSLILLQIHLFNLSRLFCPSTRPFNNHLFRTHTFRGLSPLKRDKECEKSKKLDLQLPQITGKLWFDFFKCILECSWLQRPMSSSLM